MTLARPRSKATALQRIERKLLRDAAALLTEREVALLAALLRTEFAASFPDAPLPTPAAVEDMVRWRALGRRCLQARDERGWGFRDASAVTRIPLYRLRAIEEGRFQDVKPDLARRYFRALRIEEWVSRWARANRELAARVLGVGAAP